MKVIIDNIGSVIVLFAVVAFVGFLAYSLIRAKRKSGGGCHGCSGCAMAGKCHAGCALKNTADAQEDKAN
jgi:hypothetical protein